MDELDHNFQRLTRAVAELERVCIQRENDILAKQQELFSAPRAATVPQDQLVHTLDVVIDRIQSILNRKEAA